MLKLSAVALFAIVLTVPQQARAENPSSSVRAVVGEAISKKLIERRIDVLKTTLGLTPEQAKYWPTVEEAFRARLTARHARLARLAGRLNEDREIDPFDALRARADNLAERSASLKKLVEAWRPLYQVLDENQKRRLQFVAAYMFHEMRDAIESRRAHAEDDEEHDEF